MGDRPLRSARGLIAALLALAALGTATPALAWGGTGHRLITRLALANVRPETRAQIDRLLAAAPALDTPQCPMLSLEDASTWPDCVRKDKDRFGYTTPWHFQNAPICAAAYDPAAACAHGDCVTAQIPRMRRILADRRLPAPKRLEALAFLVHFIEDIHQPLHVADLGEGGNLYPETNLPLEASGKPTSLHWVWDDTLVADLIERDGESFVHAYSSAERARIATGTPADWARESWRLARTLVYPQAFGRNPCAGAPPPGATLSDAAVARDLPVVRDRLRQAGLRLARELDGVLG